MSQHKNFETLRREKIDELQAEVTLYRHRKTGAEVLSVANDDTNKVFGIALRTPARDNTGVAHILEHTVLCGSKKYPVKDPFQELMKGSVYTFLNAMTYSDKTVYPVASENLQDFYNLMDIYIDAVFFPRLERDMFDQEGWHYELLGLDAPLSFKGVVFNEMKGVYSSPDANVSRELSRALTPDGNEGQDSGGHPADIPSLTHQGLVDFHSDFYHPSNSRIFFYGDDDPAVRLERLDAALTSFDQKTVDSSILPQALFDAPRQVARSYMPNQDEGSGSFAISAWLICDTDDPFRNASLKLLGYLLLGRSASPLRQALIESLLGDDTAGYGLDSSGVQIDFSTGLRGVKADDVPVVHALIRDTLSDLAETGFSADLIEAAFNTTEFALRENNTGSSPRGLVLMIRALGHWLYERDPFTNLEVRPLLDRLRSEVDSDPQFFQKLIRTHLLDNPHLVELRVDPDPTIGPAELAAEEERLQTVQAAFRNGDAEELVRRSHELHALQLTPDTPEALASIPRLQLADLPREIRTIPETQVAGPNDATILQYPLFTNGVWYLDLAFDLSAVPPRLFPLLPLLGRTLTEMDTSKRGYVQLSEQIGMKTGGISHTIHTGTHRSDGSTVARLIVRSKCLVERADDLLGLLHEILREPAIKRERFRQMVLEEKSAEETSLVPSGHRVVKTRLKAGYSVAEAMGEAMDGPGYVRFLRELAERIDADWNSIENDLAELRRLAFHPQRLLVNSTIDGEAQVTLQGDLESFLTKLAQDGSAPVDAIGDWQLPDGPTSEALIGPAKVNYVGSILDLGAVDYEWHGSHAVITRSMNTGYLWDRVRVKGGAYGASCGIDRGQGTMLFTSYRDPNIADTIDAYRGSAAFLQECAFDEAAIHQAIIGTIGKVDAYQLPDARGYTAFMRKLLGITDTERQQTRDQILGTSLEDFHGFGAVLERAFENARHAFVASSEQVEAEKDRLGSVVSTPLF